MLSSTVPGSMRGGRWGGGSLSGDVSTKEWEVGRSLSGGVSTEGIKGGKRVFVR